MNLLQIRQQFRVVSGRYDLVSDLGVDQGANFYINEGRKFLDRLDETQKSWGIRYHFLEPEFYAANIPTCRAIKEVWAATISPDARWQLEKMDLQELLATYLATLPSTRIPGPPQFYAPTITRHIPDNIVMDVFAAYVGYVDVPAGTAFKYTAIIVAPTPTVQTMLEIKGLFDSMELVDDIDENFWSVSHPLLLIMAAMRALEIINRNTQGVKDWENSIRTELSGMGMDLVEELIAEVSEMEG